MRWAVAKTNAARLRLLSYCHDMQEPLQAEPGKNQPIPASVPQVKLTAGSEKPPAGDPERDKAAGVRAQPIGCEQVSDGDRDLTQ